MHARFKPIYTFSCLAIFALFLVTLPAWAIPEYDFVDLSYNGETLIPYGISNDGTIVGKWRGQGWETGFILKNDAITSLHVPGGDTTTILGINPSGTACVGAYYDHSFHAHAFEYRLGGEIHRLSDLGDADSNTVATDITDSGRIVGSYYAEHALLPNPFIPTPIGEAFVIEGGQVRTYSAPGARFTSFGGVNEAGRIVGHREEGGSDAIHHPFLLEGDALSPLPLSFQSSSTEVTDINNHGQIVGWSHQVGVGTFGLLLDGDDQHVIRYSDGSTFLPTRLTGINDSGVIVGYRSEEGRRGFIAYPKAAIPEPASLALLLVGAPLLALRRRRG